MTDTKMTALADAIRSKTGKTDKLSIDEMTADVLALDVNVEPEVPDDGKTRIYITLQEGRTSPRLGVCPNGTVTVDWGDGTEPDVLTGTSTSTVKWTPAHNYASAGDYVVSLEVSGECGISGVDSKNRGSFLINYPNTYDYRNSVYLSSITRIIVGSKTTLITCPFENCYRLKNAVLPSDLTKLPEGAFNFCYDLSSITIPKGVTEVGASALRYCYGLEEIYLPDGVVAIGDNAFYNSINIRTINIPSGVTSIGKGAFYGLQLLTSLTIPAGVGDIKYQAFAACYGMKFYDFLTHTAVPTLSNANAFSNIPSDCEIRVPSALYDEWIVATNWATYADYIVAV